MVRFQLIFLHYIERLTSELERNCIGELVLLRDTMAFDHKPVPVLARKRKRNTDFNKQLHSNRQIINSSHLHRDSSFSTQIKPKSVPENYSRRKGKDWTNVGQDNGKENHNEEDSGFVLKLFTSITTTIYHKAANLIKEQFKNSDAELTPKKKRKLEKQQAKKKSLNNGGQKDPKQVLEDMKFNPILQDDYKDVSFIKSPIDWDLKEEVTPSDPSNGSDYGTSFIRRKNKYTKPTIESRYMRSVYNGQYKSPTPSDTTPPTPSSFKEDDKKLLTSMHKITEDLRKNWGGKTKKSDEDVIFLKEVKLPPATPSKFSLTFDLTKLTFEQEFKYYQKILNERRKLQDKIHKDKLEAESTSKLIKKLSKDEENNVMNIWKSKGKDSSMILTAFNIDVKVIDFKTLADKHWLNDVVIELFLKTLINDKVYAFNSYFFTTMESRGYQGVNRWMKRAKVNIANIDKVLIPINVHQTHWVLGVIDMKNKKILYMDSLATRKTSHGERALSLMYEFVKGETEKQGVPKLAEGFEFEHLLDVPQQQNGFDCGVFTLLNAFYIANNEPLTYKASDATTFRRIIGHTILSLSSKS